DEKVTVKINGQPTEYILQNGYAVLGRTWKKGDVVEVNLPMQVRQVVANENLTDDNGKTALQRGPLMYCAEWPDNNGKVSNIILPLNTNFETEFKPDLLNGVTVLKSEVPAVIIDSNGSSISTVKQPFVAIPYYAWAHRGKGEMMIWFPAKVKDIDLFTTN
ncbi:MAG TPA: glycoside hydrolase family 127 protein, partial [Panacibacter sp.]|nr:glycoside hydrolase family 127 protein [Panacibacter sp.]